MLSHTSGVSRGPLSCSTFVNLLKSGEQLGRAGSFQFHRYVTLRRLDFYSGKGTNVLSASRGLARQNTD